MGIRHAASMAGLLTAMGIATPASAAIVTTTLTGTIVPLENFVFFQIPSTGFGTPDADGLDITIKFTYDTKSNYPGIFSPNDGYIQNSSITESATTNGVTVNTLDSPLKFFSVYENSNVTVVQLSPEAGSQSDIFLDFPAGSEPLTYGVPYSGDISGSGALTTQGADVAFNINYATIAVSNVPLPASAPMFGAALLGLGGLSYAAKRKKAAAGA